MVIVKYIPNMLFMKMATNFDQPQYINVLFNALIPLGMGFWERKRYSNLQK